MSAWCAHAHTHTHSHSHMCIHIRIYASMYTRICIFVYILICTCTLAHAHLHTRTNTHDTHVHIRMRTRARTHTHTHITHYNGFLPALVGYPHCSGLPMHSAVSIVLDTLAVITCVRSEVRRTRQVVRIDDTRCQFALVPIIVVPWCR